jgi:transcriptional regulator with PAS, ATPase and Fis domain
MESELFGHQKGAFTGATARKQGFFEVANGGTLFLDEIGELRPDLQVKLLRALQEKEILPIGFTRAIPVDVRIISATNKNIDEAISHGEFREDLYYRLNVINIHIPPLRERPEDIKPTAEFFFRKLQEEKHKLYLTIADSVWALLSSYDWPGNVRELRNTIESAVVLAKGDEILPEHFLKKEAHLLNEPGNQYQIVGKSAAILELMKQIGIVAPQDVTVLIYGETGSGKELVARNIHLNSKRSQAKFEARNCGAFSEQLLESELFGHEKGAFTGAIRQRKGIFEDADGGTIFLDEIGNTSLNLQQKLLRVLQEREFERVGGNETIKTDIRLIAATNKDLKEEVKQGKFREDLFYRLNVIPLHIPPLRDRKEDIPLLAHYFREKFSREHEKSIRDFDDKVIEIFKDYSWPGNVRELENAIERAVTYCEGADIIAEMHLPPHIVKERKDDDGISIFDSFLSIETFEEACNAFSKYFLEAKLKENDWNVKQTAERIKHARSKVYEKMKDYGIMRS